MDHPKSLLWWAQQTPPDGEQRTRTFGDLDKKLNEVFAAKPTWGKNSTVTIHPDGYHEPGEPDVDDAPLAVDDVVAWSVLRSSLFRSATLPERIPYLLGVVRSTEPWDESLAGMVYVRFGNGAGAWKERDQLRKMPEVE